jgi:four helix bundle protein
MIVDWEETRTLRPMQDFRHIKAWQRGHALSIAIRKRTRGFTRAGFADLRSELTRSAASMPSTIVEGCGTDSNKEFARYLGMSIDSASETEYHLLVARDHGLLSLDEWQRFSAETVEIRKMTYGYRRKVLNSDP